MKQFGLIGYPLSHSFSPSYFNRKFEAEQLECHYSSFPIEHIKLLPRLINSNPILAGLNVTIPYKSLVIPFLDRISVSAKEINAVNCIKIIDGKLFGFNTDFMGFAESLKPLLRKDIKNALVLGTGGSSKGVCFALTQLGLGYKLVSQSGNGDYEYQELNSEIIRENLLIVNTTPLGMFPLTNQCPNFPFQYLSEKHLLFDLIYNPEETLFLHNGRLRNAQIKNGKEMLILQAEKSWSIWNDSNSINDMVILK
jgi:shikimate dehydrogenase